MSFQWDIRCNGLASFLQLNIYDAMSGVGCFTSHNSICIVNVLQLCVCNEISTTYEGIIIYTLYTDAVIRYQFNPMLGTEKKKRSYINEVTLYFFFTNVKHILSLSLKQDSDKYHICFFL